MAAIGSRFNSLLLNAHDPLETSQKKPKKKKEKKTNQKPDDAKTQSSKVDVPKVSDKPQSETSQALKIVVRDVPLGTAQTTKVEVSDPQVVIVEEPLPPTDFDDVSKDDRASRAKSTYRKMMVRGRGRVFDRHGGPQTRVKPVEKKQGHGAYNWGDVGEGTSQVIIEDVPEDTNDSPSKPVVEIEQYTLEQYKKLLKENKADPLSWESVLQGTETVAEPAYEDIRLYEYPRENQNVRGRYRGNRPRRGGFQRPSQDGEQQSDHHVFESHPQRGSGPRRGSSGFRGPRVHSRGYQNNVPKEIKIENINEFPEL